MRLIRLILTADGRRYIRALWWTIRTNGKRMHPTTPTVTITIIKSDNRLFRVHGIPARNVDAFVEMSARKGERVLIGEESVARKPAGEAV